MTDKLMRLVGLRTIEIINEQVRQGIDETNTKYAYSRKPFAMPLGNRIKNYKSLATRGELTLFTSKKTGKLWVAVTGGYAKYREMIGRNPTGDFLQDRGDLLRSLRATPTGNAEVTIGAMDAKTAKKIFWLHVSGAGKSRKRWRFFGLTDQNKQRLADYASSHATSEDIAAIVGKLQ